MVSDPETEDGVGAEEVADAGLDEAAVAREDTEAGTEADDGADPELDSEAVIAAEEEGEAEAEAESETHPGMEPEDGTEEGPGDDPQTELESAQAELNRLRDQHLRLAADFENHRKRASADLAGVWGRAQADLVRSLVEGLDDLQRVSQFTSDDTTVDALIEGVDLVERNLLKALTEAGLKVLNPLGERFDPNSMEAMMRVPTEEEGQDETVHQVFQKGYMFKEQLVRPARVSVYMDED